jgi:hypothetical protein
VRTEPAAAERVLPAIETGPATSPSIPGTGPRLLPLTEILDGLPVKPGIGEEAVDNLVGHAPLAISFHGWTRRPASIRTSLQDHG